MGIKRRLRRQQKASEELDWERNIREFEKAISLAEKMGSEKLLSVMSERMSNGMKENLLSQLERGSSREEIMEAANRMLEELKSNDRYMRIMQRLGIKDGDLEELFIGTAKEVIPQ